jgi:hypothetical protein
MWMIRAAAAALAIAVLLGSVAGPAIADSRDHRRPVRHRRAPPPRWGYDQPTYVQAPPPVVYAPPEGPAALNFSVNLR